VGRIKKRWHVITLRAIYQWLNRNEVRYHESLVACPGRDGRETSAGGGGPLWRSAADSTVGSACIPALRDFAG